LLQASIELEIALKQLHEQRQQQMKQDMSLKRRKRLFPTNTQSQMKYFLCLFLFFGIFSVHADYTNCSPPNAPFNLTSLVLVPDPPKIGLDAQINATGILNEVVTGGRVYFTVQWYSNGGWHNLPSFQFDLCNLAQCPISDKIIRYNTTISVPSFTPSGKYRGKLQVLDQNNAIILCLSYLYDLEPPAKFVSN